MTSEPTSVPVWPGLISASVVAIIIWRLCSRTGGRAAFSEPTWKAGPWPVEPGCVHTPQELIQAFEHLSLLRLGLSARTRNHLEIAEDLASQPGTDGLRKAARHLAFLYERARYTPAGAALADEELVTARNTITLLAGFASL